MQKGSYDAVREEWGQVSCTFADFRTVYRDYFGSCSVTHFRAVCGQPFLGSRGLASPAHQCTEVLRTSPHHSRAEGATFRDCEKPAKVPTRPAKNQTDSCCQNAMVGRVIAISRTPLWLPSGWGCRSRRPSGGRRNLG